MAGIAMAFIVVGFLIARTGSPPSSVAWGERSTEPSVRPDASSGDERIEPRPDSGHRPTGSRSLPSLRLDRTIRRRPTDG